MLKYAILLIVFLIHNALFAQWDQYEAVWKGKPGRMMVNLDFKTAPESDDLTYVLEVTQETLACDGQGYPLVDDLDRIESFATRIDTLLSAHTLITDVGRFFYQCTVKDYYYLKDTALLHQLLSGFSDNIVDYTVIQDKERRVYDDFIYPDDFLMQTMANSRIINLLRSAQFDLNSKSELKHFASFASDAERTKYRRFLQEQNFKIVELDKSESSAFNYKIMFTRNDKLHLELLSNITLRLHQKAEFLNGLYEGWEIELER